MGCEACHLIFFFIRNKSNLFLVPIPGCHTMPRATLRLSPSTGNRGRETRGGERESEGERKREVAPDKQRRRETKENATQLGRESESREEKYWGS